MATLIKRPGSKYWIAAFDVPQPDGTTRRLKKSTKRTKRSEALIEAVRLEELECKAGTANGANASQAYAILSEAAAAASTRSAATKTPGSASPAVQSPRNSMSDNPQSHPNFSSAPSHWLGACI